MTTVSATPQQMRDRLLQAIDSQSNICNMVVVLEVITYLEKYPITKEALEETRLGKLINDLRKKTKDEDLAKRAKKLLRTWQKLIDPGGAAETPSRGPAVGPLGSTNGGGSHPCRADAPPPDVSVPTRGGPEVKVRNDVHNTYSPKAEKSGAGRKRRADRGDAAVHVPEKVSKMSACDGDTSSPLTNGVASSPPPELDRVPSPDRPHSEPPENDKHSRIPVNAVKPRPSSPGAAKPPNSSSSSMKAPVTQPVRVDEGEGGRGGDYCQAKSPRGLAASPRASVKTEAVSKRSSAYAPKGAPIPAPPPQGSPQPVPCPAQGAYSDRLPHSSHHRPPPSAHWVASSEPPALSPPRLPDATLEVPSASPPAPSPSRHHTDPLRPSSEGPVAGGGAEGPERKRRKKYRSRDYAVNLDGQRTEDATKPVRLKERRITFDPVTGQIKPMAHKEPSQTEEVAITPGPAEPRPRAEGCVLQSPPPPAPSSFQQTNWKELSRNEIIQSYLNLQSNVLTSSGVRAPGSHFFTSDYLKREEPGATPQVRQTHTLQAEATPGDSPGPALPGVGRAVTEADLSRVHTQHWQGVNGCHDTKGAWYDWTECISLDPHGDGSKLNILPYVCLD